MEECKEILERIASALETIVSALGLEKDMSNG